MLNFTNKKRGFTLIELLVVISIISLLASVVLAALNSARAKARDARRISDLIQIRTALNLYASDNNGNYPPTNYASTLVGSTNGWDIFQILLAPYIKNLPADPTNNGAYHYTYIGNFATSWDTTGPEGTCLGKAVLFATAMESSATRHDCTLNATTEQYPKEIVLQIN
jgi:type II secretion system protein G